MTPALTEILKISLLVLLIVAAVAASLTKRTLHAIIVFTSFSLIMALVWMLLESPDLAITEAAVGAGVSGVLFFMALRRVGRMKHDAGSNSQPGNTDTKKNNAASEARDETEG